ncbi:MAG: NAD-dependent epimerase/dehydratase family protein [Sandaracinus sp.]|nr:NAD-dependent epimerase/dehydratase family protein [Sandaracinus sp.]
MLDLSPLGRCLVTGAGGYLGRNLVRRLVDAGLEVRAFDRRFPVAMPEGVDVREADVRDDDAVRAACEGIDTVFHCAAIIDTRSRAPAKDKAFVHDVNVGGVRRVMEASRAAGATRMVLTSSVNVVVDRPYEGADESVPYATIPPLDLYTITKAEAEKLVLAADAEGFHTCALRPGGIYGPEEPTHFPRAVREILRGLFVVRVGGGKTIADNVFIDDLVDAHVRGALALGPEGKANGRAYFLSDGEPMSYFDFFAPTAIELGYKPPKASMPVWPVRLAAECAEWLSFLGIHPFLTRMELYKLVTNHWFSIAAAERDLGWKPQFGHAEGMARCRPWVRRLAATMPRVIRPHLLWWIAIFGGLGLTFTLALSASAYASFTSVIPLFPRVVVQVIAAVALALHVGEGLYAYSRARAAKLPTAAGWGIQTLLLGYPSLRLLHRELRGTNEPALAEGPSEEPT